MNKQITFAKADKKHLSLVMQWLAEPHMQAFWDNSQEHKDDITNFVEGHKQTYFYGTTKYWIAYIDNEAFAFILSDDILPKQTMSELHKQHLSSKGHTICLDFGIGNTNYLGKGLAATTLDAFMQFYRHEIDQHADTFFIDPDQNNPRAIHVYTQAGFTLIGNFSMESGYFTGQSTCLMVRRF